MYAILVLAGCAIMFFGYDASVMSLVNTNPDYLALMGAAGGSNRDSAAVGGIVSVWFGGFAIGMSKRTFVLWLLLTLDRSHLCWYVCGQDWSTEDH